MHSYLSYQCVFCLENVIIVNLNVCYSLNLWLFYSLSKALNCGNVFFFFSSMHSYLTLSYQCVFCLENVIIVNLSVCYNLNLWLFYSLSKALNCGNVFFFFSSMHSYLTLSYQCVFCFENVICLICLLHIVKCTLENFYLGSKHYEP